MSTILFDLTALQPQKSAFKHGGGTYASFVLKRMLQRDLSFYAFYNSKNYLDKNISLSLKEHHIKTFDISIISFDNIVRQLNDPIVFSILPKPYMFIVKTIGNIHDCRELELTNDAWELYYPTSLRRLLVKVYESLFPAFYLKRQKKKLFSVIANVNFIPVTVTLYTKYKLLSFFPELKTKIQQMIVAGAPFSFNGQPEPYEVKDKMFLMVSGNRWLKNNLRAIVALDELFTLGELPNFKVTITGLPTTNFFKKKIRNIDRFITLDYVDDNELKNLYKKAYCFIFPSLNEGFGMPPLEAMKYGTPVIATNMTAVPEVCGDAAIYINPYSVEDIKSKILMIAHESEYYLELQRKSLRHYTHMVKKTLEETDKYIDYVIAKSESI